MIIKVIGPPPPENPNGRNDLNSRMKALARHKSIGVLNAYTQIGPECRFLLPAKGKGIERIAFRKLNVRERAFGVKRPRDGKTGGFKGLVTWQWCSHRDGDYGLVTLDMKAARQIQDDEWLATFVKETLVLCSWEIVEEIPEQNHEEPVAS
jgi:hypothetical protein